MTALGNGNERGEDGGRVSCETMAAHRPASLSVASSSSCAGGDAEVGRGGTARHSWSGRCQLCFGVRGETDARGGWFGRVMGAHLRG